MADFQEVYRRTQQKYELLVQKDKLESELKLLDSEIQRLKIIAHNEQADVDNLEGPSLKGLLLSITGKKQEHLEQEKMQARNAVQNYESTKARRESTLQRLDTCVSELTSLGACDESLEQMISFPKDEALTILTQCQKDLPCIQEKISSLITTLARLLQWSAVRNGTTAPSALSGIDDNLQATERQAQNMLEQLKTDLLYLQERTANYGITINSGELQSIAHNYLTDLYTYAMITSRVEKVTVILRQIGFQLDAAQRKLTQLVKEFNIQYLFTLLEAAKKANL